MLAEGIHSLVDTSNEIVLIIGIRRARRPPDDLHQFGHGKEIYFWTLVVAVLLFAVGGGLAFYEGLTHFFDPHPIDNVFASYVVLAISFALEAASTFVAVRELEPAKTFWRALLDTKDASVLAVLVENIAAMIGLIFAFVGLLLTELTGNPRFDALGSLAVGIVLMAVAVFLAGESRALLIGEFVLRGHSWRAREIQWRRRQESRRSSRSARCTLVQTTSWSRPRSGLRQIKAICRR